MTTHTRTYLEVQANYIVYQAIAEPERMFWLPGYTATVMACGNGKLQMWVSDKLHCEYTPHQRKELVAHLVDDWALEQGDEGE
jgi:hypothetical protein